MSGSFGFQGSGGSGGGNSALTKVVDIPSNQILNLASFPIQLLPPPALNQFYAISKIVLEYKDGSIPYLLLTDLIFINNPFANFFSKSFITKSGNKAMVFVQNAVLVSPSLSVLYKSDTNILGIGLTMSADSNPTNGNGKIRAIITYTLETYSL